jgi:tocopherol cyclase
MIGTCQAINQINESTNQRINRSMLNYLRRWRSLWNPAMYHGWGKACNYFEGWYFKIVDPKEVHAIAIIPGISRNGAGAEHAFIQVLFGKRCRSDYIRFEAGEFRPSGRRFELRIGGNYFAADRMKLDLLQLKGTLKFRDLYSWPKSLGAPGIMGWYSFIPFMECYHGIVSVDHQISGTLKVFGEEVDFTGGKGYTEKDWGQSFPSSWIWMQTNHFGAAATASLTASVARIPWLGSYFIGYIVGFLLEGRLHRFATYTGAMMRARLEADCVHLAFRDRRRRLEITAEQGAGVELLSPLSGEMTGKINESMQAIIEVRLYEDGRLVYEGTGHNAGLEVAGPVEELLTDSWRR